MIKKREDFATLNEYKDYTATDEFLFNYIWKNKNKDQIKADMVLTNQEENVLDKAINKFHFYNEKLKRNKDYNAYELEKIIDQILDSDSKTEKWDESEITFIEREY